MTYNRLEELNKMKVTISMLEQIIEKLNDSRIIEIRMGDLFGYAIDRGVSMPEELKRKFLDLTSLELEQKKKQFEEI